MLILSVLFCFFFFNDTATTEIYTLSLHDALPISRRRRAGRPHPEHPPVKSRALIHSLERVLERTLPFRAVRSEEHTSELQSLAYLVCRLLLEKKKII